MDWERERRIRDATDRLSRPMDRQLRYVLIALGLLIGSAYLLVCAIWLHEHIRELRLL